MAYADEGYLEEGSGDDGEYVPVPSSEPFYWYYPTYPYYPYYAYYPYYPSWGFYGYHYGWPFYARWHWGYPWQHHHYGFRFGFVIGGSWGCLLATSNILNDGTSRDGGASGSQGSPGFTE